MSRFSPCHCEFVVFSLGCILFYLWMSWMGQTLTAVFEILMMTNPDDDTRNACGIWYTLCYRLCYTLYCTLASIQSDTSALLPFEISSVKWHRRCQISTVLLERVSEIIQFSSNQFFLSGAEWNAIPSQPSFCHHMMVTREVCIENWSLDHTTLMWILAGGWNITHVNFWRLLAREYVIICSGQYYIILKPRHVEVLKTAGSIVTVTMLRFTSKFTEV